MDIEVLFIAVISFYFLVGISQIFTAYKMKKEAEAMEFPEKIFFVSVIIPIKEVVRTTRHNLGSVCRQEYPRYEVLFVAESVRDGAYPVAKELEVAYPHARVLISGRHESDRTIGKCHNLIFGARHAKGQVFLFGDSDVSYSKDWIKKMTSPLIEIVDGKCIEAITAPFFIEPEGFIGKFVALSVSLVTFTASFTKRDQRFPPYASGASIAITRDVFEKSKVVQKWENAFNDDLVLADTLLDQGYHIYNQMAHLNHPNEAFSNLRQTNEKLIRWVVTISTFGHRNLRAEVPLMVARNLQFQVALVMALSLLFFGFSYVLVLFIVTAGYVYLVTYRWLVGKIIEEKGLNAYYIIAPISITAMMLFFAFVRLYFRSFSWEGRTYTMRGRYSI